MSPRNYHAKFTPGSNQDFWWHFSSSKIELPAEKRIKKRKALKLMKKIRKKSFD